MRRLALALSFALFALPAPLAGAADATGLARRQSTLRHSDGRRRHGRRRGARPAHAGHWRGGHADERGYWRTTDDGMVLRYGDAPDEGSAAGQRLNQPVVGMAAHPAPAVATA